MKRTMKMTSTSHTQVYPSTQSQLNNSWCPPVSLGTQWESPRSPESLLKMSEQGVFVPSAWYFGGFLEFLSWRCLLKNIICSFSHSDCKCKTQILKMEKSWKYTEATVTKFKNSCTIQLLRENSCWHLRSWSKSFVCVCTPFIQGL